ncbi:ribonuclease inhibitor-like [Pungitius pungitius]|uniref:ribonuclease inhibitor-like n=1 Tax=Pungitius pungitius TaxID=134920 RepID=UPI002E0E6C07
MATSWQCLTTCLSTTTLSTAEGPADWSPASLWRILWNMPPRASKPLVPVRAGPPAGRWSSSLGRTFLTACRWCLAACWCGVSLHACNLTVSCCENLAKNINPSQVRELDLSNNNLTDAGITLLSKKLKNSKLEKLRLRSCNLTQHSSDDLTAVISSASCQLRELDLSDNDLQDVGVKTLSGGLESPHCQLKILSVSLCRVTEEGCTFLASALNSSSMRELDLSYNHPGELGVQLLSALMADPQCSLQKLRRSS